MLTRFAVCEHIERHLTFNVPDLCGVYKFRDGISDSNRVRAILGGPHDVRDHAEQVAGKYPAQCLPPESLHFQDAAQQAYIFDDILRVPVPIP